LLHCREIHGIFDNGEIVRDDLRRYREGKDLLFVKALDSLKELAEQVSQWIADEVDNVILDPELLDFEGFPLAH
jgi:hypothetical protein